MCKKLGLLIGALYLSFAGCKTAQIDETAGVSGIAGKPTQPLIAAWTQLGPGGELIARVITAATASCPSINVDGVPLRLKARTAPSTDFQILVCEGIVPASAHTALLDNEPLPLPKANPHRIIVFGDTGCRMKSEKTGQFIYQGCDATHWPLAQIAGVIAAMKPDLVVHVGDYHYREGSCPIGNTGCKQDIAGDNWTSWQQDFITPVMPLFSAAPMILVRGNHELCSRGGNGWFHLLDPRPMQSCTDKTDPYWITMGDHRLGIMDSAIDSNHQPSLDQLAKTPTQNAIVWFITHRPFLTPGADDETTVPPPVLPAAFDGVGKVAMVMVGHQHRLSLNTFNDTKPPEIVTGNGGTLLDSEIVAGQVYTPFKGKGFEAKEWFDFGFLMFDRQTADTWAVTEYDRRGKAVFKCSMNEALGQQTAFDCSMTPKS